MKVEDNGRSTYSPTDRATIQDAFVRKLDMFGGKIDGRHVMESVESAASFYVDWRDASRVPDLSPSQQARYWKGVAGKLSVARSALTDAAQHYRRMPEMHAAASDIGRLDGDFPDFEPDRVPVGDGSDSSAQQFVRVWPVERQLERINKLVGWAERVAERANERATWLSMGKGPDEALHTFVRQLDQVYRALAADPKNPKTENHRDNLKGGELLQFLDACLRPLGIALTPEGMTSLWRRAMVGVRKGRRRGSDAYKRRKRPNTGKG